MNIINCLYSDSEISKELQLGNFQLNFGRLKSPNKKVLSSLLELNSARKSEINVRRFEKLSSSEVGG